MLEKLTRFSIVRFAIHKFLVIFRPKARMEALKDKVYGVVVASPELMEQCKEIAQATKYVPGRMPKAILPYPTWLDGLQGMGIFAVEMATGERYEFKPKKCEWALVRSKVKTEPIAKTRKPKATATPKTRRVMDPRTGEFEDVTI